MAQEKWTLVDEEPEKAEVWKLVEDDKKTKKSPWYVPNLGLVRPILAGAQTGAAATTNALVGISDKIADALGVKKSDFARNIARDLEAYSVANREKGVGGIAGDVAAGVGQAAFDIPTIMTLGPAGLPVHGAVMGGAEGGLGGALTGAVQGVLSQGALHGISGLPDPLIRAGVGAAFGGATTPGGVRERVAGAATMGGLSFPGGTKRTGPVDLRAKQDIAKAKAMEAAGIKPEAIGETPAPPSPLGQPGVEGNVAAGMMIPGMEMPKYAGRLNVSRIEADHATMQSLAQAALDVEPNRATGPRGKVSFEEMDATATDLGLSGGASELAAKLKGKVKNLPEYMKAVRDKNVDIHNAFEAAREKYAQDPTTANLALMNEANIQRHVFTLEVLQDQGEIARALAFMRSNATATGEVNPAAIPKLLKKLGIAEITPDLVAHIESLPPEARVKFLAQIKPATTRQKIFEVWMNMILSNPLTHAVNMTSNAATLLWRAGENMIGEGPGAASANAVGTMRGIKDGLKLAWERMKGNIDPNDVSKLEIPTQAIKGKKGEVVRIPSKFLGAEDALFKTAIYEGKIYSEAYKQATTEGLKGQARRARVEEIAQKPTEAMQKVAQQEALYLTFNDKLNGIAADVAKMRQRSKIPIEFIIPFVRTPYNIAKFGLQRTPLGIPDLIGKARSGEIPKAEVVKRAASIGLTTAANIAIAQMVMDGTITGSGPKDPKERAQLYAQGWQPRSVKIGDTYYGYGRLEPISTIFGIYADFWDIKHRATDMEANKIVGLVATSLKNNLLDKTFMSGLMNLVKASDDPGRYGSDWVQQMGGSVVPAVVAGAARAIDPNLREAQSVLDTIKSRIPGMTQQVSARLGPFGETSQRAGTPLSRMFSPVPMSKAIDDPVYKELDRLGIRISTPMLTVKGEKAPREDQRRLIQAAMPDVKAAVLRIIGTPYYKAMPDENKKKFLESQMNKTRAFQRKLFIMENKQ